MRFVIYGAGAVGCYFGARLLQAGHEVSFIARGAQLAALRAQGLQVAGVGEQFHLEEVRAYESPAQVGTVDYVLVAVKAWQVAEVAEQLMPLLDEHTLVLTLQNGVEAPYLVARHTGETRSLGGVVRGFFVMEGPGVVRHVGVQPHITFGPINHQVMPAAAALLETLHSAGIDSRLSEVIEVALWEKFLLVCSLSGVGAVTRAPIGAIRAHALTRQMLADAMVEIEQVARARGVALPADIVSRTMAFVDTFPYDATASMQRDIVEGRPSELEAQTGAVVRFADEVKVSVPVNRLIYASLLLQENQARGQQTANV